MFAFEIRSACFFLVVSRDGVVHIFVESCFFLENVLTENHQSGRNPELKPPISPSPRVVKIPKKVRPKSHRLNISQPRESVAKHVQKSVQASVHAVPIHFSRQESSIVRPDSAGDNPEKISKIRSQNFPQARRIRFRVSSHDSHPRKQQ